MEAGAIYPASDRFFASIANGGARRTRVDVLVDGDVERSITGSQAKDAAAGVFVQSIGGRVDVARQQIRRSGQVTFADVSGQVLPSEVNDLLVPLRGEIRPYVGVQYWDATPAEVAAGTDVEWVPVATLVIEGKSGSYPAYTVSGRDRMSLLPALTNPFGTRPNTSVRTALASLLTTLVPGSRLRYRIPGTEHVTGNQSWEEGTPSLDVATDLATAGGWMLYCDPLGVFVADEEPATTDPAVFSYTPGPASIMMRPSDEVDASQAYTSVVVTTDPQDGLQVFKSVVLDSDPKSVTYAAAVGQRPYRQSSPLYRTQAQCNLAAKTLARRVFGISGKIVINAVPNPCLEAADVLYVEDPDQGIALNVLADAFTVGLRASDGAQAIETRSRVIR